jgi:hypothetical protein
MITCPRVRLRWGVIDCSRYGHGIRVAKGREVRVLNNTLEQLSSYGLMLASDSRVVPNLTIKGNTLRDMPHLVRLGLPHNRPGLKMDENRYASNGLFIADGLVTTPEFDQWKRSLRAYRLEQNSQKR